MTARIVKECLAQDVSLWQVDGLITEETARLLRERYDVRSIGIAAVAKYLGIVGAILAGLGILGAATVFSGSMIFGAIGLVCVAAVFLGFGLRLARDPLDRSAYSSRALLAIGLFALAGAGFAAAEASDAETGIIILITGLATVPIAFVLAYRFKNGFLLLLGLLGLFHWIGSWSAMVGRSTYELDIQDPRVMAIAAAGAVAIGLLHRRGKIPGPSHFDVVWLSVGLLYVNLSLLVLTVWPHDGRLRWILLALGVALLQILLGAAQKSAVILGFGVTSLLVNLYTRYFENFWDSLEKGLFFLVGGALLFSFGAAYERLARRLSETSPPDATSNAGKRAGL